MSSIQMEAFEVGGFTSLVRSPAPSDTTLIVHLAMRVCCYKSGANLLGVNKLRAQCMQQDVWLH